MKFVQRLRRIYQENGNSISMTVMGFTLFVSKAVDREHEPFVSCSEKCDAGQGATWRAYRTVTNVIYMIKYILG